MQPGASPGQVRPGRKVSQLYLAILLRHFYKLKYRSIQIKKKEGREEGRVTWISNARKLWKKDVLGAGGALAVGGEAKGRVWECEATTGQPAFP